MDKRNLRPAARCRYPDADPADQAEEGTCATEGQHAPAAQAVPRSGKPVPAHPSTQAFAFSARWTQNYRISLSPSLPAALCPGAQTQNKAAVPCAAAQLRPYAQDQPDPRRPPQAT